MEERSFIHVLPLLWQNKILIITTVLIAGLVTSVVMLLKPNYYRSFTTFYPVSSALLEPSAQINDRAVKYYGDDSDVDRLLSMAHSTDIAQKLLNQFNLADHYNIPVDNPKGKVRLIKKFKKHFRVQKTKYDAIELAIEDEDPEMAQRLTQAALDLINSKALNIIHSSQKMLLDNLKSAFNANNNRLSEVTDSLMALRSRYGIYDTKTQAEALTTLEIKSPGDRTLRNRIANYSAGISFVKNLEAEQEELNEGLAENAFQIQQIESTLTSQNPAIHIIEKAFVPIEKSRPKRSLYILGAMIFMGLTTMAFILIRENLRTVNF